MDSLPPRISTLTLLNSSGSCSLQGHVPWRSALRFLAVNWLTISPIRSETGRRVPSCQLPPLKRNGRTKSTPLIWLSGIQALPPFKTPWPPASKPCPAAAENATCAYISPSRRVIFQSGGISGWNTLSACFGHHAWPRKRSPSQRPVRRIGPIFSACNEPLNRNQVGSRPSILNLSVDGGRTLPPLKVVLPASSDNVPLNFGCCSLRSQ